MEKTLHAEIVEECDPQVAMCDFLLRHLPDEIQRIVRERAEHNGHTAQSELRDILSGRADQTWEDYFDAADRAEAAKGPGPDDARTRRGPVAG